MENIILHALLSFSFTERGPLPPVGTVGEACYDPFGCFSLESPWAGTTERPVAVLPMPLNVSTPIFCFHTPERPSCHKLSLQNIGDLYTSSFDRTAPLYLITHGYMESAKLHWMVDMREALLKVAPKVGVITVDWSAAAHPPYAQAVANIRLSGAVTGYLLHLLVEIFDVPLSNIHLVGHSLGSHFMSYAGDFVKTTTGRKIGRITGLDPAGPYFVNTPTEVRLDPNDAEFVDVIHTDIQKEAWEINKLGLADPVGHVDFYPNGGFNQAGCVSSAHARIDKKKSFAEGMFSYIGCNHQRSHAFFTESVTSKCFFMGVICDSWEQFLQGSCWGCRNDKCPVMGFQAKPLKQVSFGNNAKSSSSQEASGSSVLDVDNNTYRRGMKVARATDSPLDNPSASTVKIYLGTNSKAPFCAEQYRVTLVTSGAGWSQESVGDVARFTLKVRGQNGELVISPSEKATFIEPGGRQSWLGFTSQLGRLTALQVDYEEDQGLLHALIWRFSRPSLFVDSFIVEELTTGLTTIFQFCNGKMEAGDSIVLFPNEQCQQTDETSVVTEADWL